MVDFGLAVCFCNGFLAFGPGFRGKMYLVASVDMGSSSLPLLLIPLNFPVRWEVVLGQASKTSQGALVVFEWLRSLIRKESVMDVMCRIYPVILSNQCWKSWMVVA